MAATLKGKAIIYAIGSITYSAGITVAGTELAAHQGFEFERSSDNSYVKNGNGDDVSAAYGNKRKRLTITVIPAGTAIADARSLSDKFLIPSGTTVTIVDPESTISDGSYNVERSRATRTVDGAQANVLELEARDDNDITTTVS